MDDSSRGDIENCDCVTVGEAPPMYNLPIGSLDLRPTPFVTNQVPPSVPSRGGNLVSHMPEHRHSSGIKMAAVATGNRENEMKDEFPNFPRLVQNLNTETRPGCALLLSLVIPLACSGDISNKKDLVESDDPLNQFTQEGCHGGLSQGSFPSPVSVLELQLRNSNKTDQLNSRLPCNYSPKSLAHVGNYSPSTAVTIPLTSPGDPGSYFTANLPSKMYNPPMIQTKSNLGLKNKNYSSIDSLETLSNLMLHPIPHELIPGITISSRFW